MKSQRILVLLHTSLIPPENLADYTEQEIDEFRTELDVLQHLRAAGHEVRPLGLDDNLADLRQALSQWKPNIAFNLLEEFQGIASYDQHVVALLELMRQPYTGCNPRGLMISRDKALAKQILIFHRVPTPRFAVLHRNHRYRVPKKLKFPLFVKSVSDDASLGISQASLVRNVEHLQERVEFIHQQTKADALVEEYIEGREFYVGVLGNQRLRTLPVWELHFGDAADMTHGFATSKVKWDRNYQLKHDISTEAATNLPSGAAEYLDKLAKRIYRALSLSGYARIDFRMRPDGSFFFLEANANPNLSEDEDFATSALSVGIKYPALLEQIIRLGAGYRAAWRLLE